ncbi:IS1634 family transposase [Ammoniphilus sp. 3BR4]|uniref:IS1634 family transposase n=1 Tax=Ammoniphilus sp. 3BR4 TaxID=3158265 RepID=UPI0034674802
MYIKVNKQKNKDGSLRQYIQVARSFRVNKKQVRQETLCTLGRLEDLQEGDLDTLIEGLAKFSDRYFERIHGKGNLPISIHWTKDFGPAFIFRKIWEKLNLKGFLQRAIEDTHIVSHLDEAIFAMVLNRLMAPSSKYGLFRQWVQTIYAQGLSELQLHHYYRALDFLTEQKESMEQHLFGQLTDLLNLEVDLVFYDTTSSYFEGDGPEELAEYGYSKDHRGDRKQVVIGLLMTKQGIPVAHQVFPGNLHDTKTFSLVIQDLKSRFQVDKVILVGDRGMVSETNLEEIRKLDMEYIVGVKLRKSKKAQQLLSIRGRYTQVKKNLEIKSAKIDGDTYVLCYNPDGAERDKISRDIVLEKLRKKITELGPTGLVKNRAYSKFLTIDKAAASIDEEKIKEDARFDGKYAVRSNSSLSAQEIALAYKQLWRVEAAFRDLKQNLDLRPMYHRTEDRVRGHIMICFLALVLESFMRLKLKESGSTSSYSQVMHDLEQLKVSKVLTEGKEVVVRNELTGQAFDAFKALGTQVPPRILEGGESIEEPATE